MIQQTTFYISPEVAAGLLSGDLVRHGGVVRQATGPIFQHLPEIDLPPESADILARVARTLRNPWVAAPIVTAVAVAVAAPVLANRRRREVRAVIDRYRAALREYLEALQEGRLDAETIRNFMSALEAVQGLGAATLDVLKPKTQVMTDIVKTATKQLVEDNHFDLTEGGTVNQSAEDGVVDLYRHLQLQHRYFTDAA